MPYDSSKVEFKDKMDMFFMAMEAQRPKDKKKTKKISREPTKIIVNEHADSTAARVKEI